MEGLGYMETAFLQWRHLLFNIGFPVASAQVLHWGKEFILSKSKRLKSSSLTDREGIISHLVFPLGMYQITH